MIVSRSEEILHYGEAPPRFLEGVHDFLPVGIVMVRLGDDQDSCETFHGLDGGCFDELHGHIQPPRIVFCNT